MGKGFSKKLRLLSKKQRIIDPSREHDIRHGDCVELMARMIPNSVDCIVTDPPYGLEFMNAKWDKLWDKRGGDPDKFESGKKWAQEQGCRKSGNKGYSGLTGNPSAYVAGIRAQEWHFAWAEQALRVLKPGGHILAFGGTRTYHRLVCALEDAGFEIRDCLMWLYGSGFPKSMDVSIALDKEIGADREVVAVDKRRNSPSGVVACGRESVPVDRKITAPSSDDARKWEGWGTALKPAHEPICLGRKPLTGTVARNIRRYGTGGMNIDGCRIETQAESFTDNRPDKIQQNAYGKYGTADYDGSKGRWPTNIILSHHPECEKRGTKEIKGIPGGNTSGKTAFFGKDDKKITPVERAEREVVEDWECHPECPVRLLDEQSGESVSTDRVRKNQEDKKTIKFTSAPDGIRESFGHSDVGGASRFFYCAKASGAERDLGLHKEKNIHPTVKPIALMRYLIKLVCPTHGVVLDPFCGSGTTLVAAMIEKMNAVGIEQDENFAEIARARVKEELRRLKL